MKVLVNCRGLYPQKSGGLENFALAVICGVAGHVEEVVLDVRRPDVPFYEGYFRSYSNVSLVSDPKQGFWFFVDDWIRRFPALRKVIRNVGKSLRTNPLKAKEEWANEQRADVVYYPSHRDEPQHKSIPMVATVHAILPEYGAKEMDQIRRHMESARAIVTSWPQPFRELTERYPFVKDRLFMVPYTAEQNVKGGGAEHLTGLNLPDSFYLYPAVIIPRKNHQNLIKAYGLLKQRGLDAPAVVCTGGNVHEDHTSGLLQLAKEEGVTDKFLFLGQVSSERMSALYHACTGTLCCSFWEAAIAAIQEGVSAEKPVICSDIEPARAHAKLFDVDVCYFDPADPSDMADQLVYFGRNLQRYRESSVRAADTVRRVDTAYMGRCYADILRYAAGLAEKPSWAPFLFPTNAPWSNPGTDFHIDL